MSCAGERDHDCPSRRRVLRGAGLAGLAPVVLAACGGPPPQVSGTLGADGKVRIPTQDVPVGGAAFIRDRLLVLSHPVEGRYVVFDATCPHQGCAVSEVRDGQLVCPCHHSVFDPDSGDPLSGPATTALTVVPSTLEGDQVVISG